MGKLRDHPRASASVASSSSGFSLIRAGASLFSPAAEAARGYSRRKLARDAVAGVTVAAVEVPQAMAYALLAGVPAQYGIYTSVVQGVIAALLGGSGHVRTGPTNTQSLLAAAAVSRLGGADDPDTYLRLVVALTLIKGVVQLACAAAGLGAVVRYVSRSVIVGLTAGAGLLIAVGQLPHVLGVPAGAARSRQLPGALGDAARLWPHLSGVDWRAIAIAAATVAFVVIGRRASRFFPGPLLAIAGGAVAVAALGWAGGGGLPTVGTLPSGLPAVGVPLTTWDEAESLLGGAVALALIGMIETVAIAKGVGGHAGDGVAPEREFVAQGMANALSSFAGCIPGSGSFTRSTLDHAAGAATRFSALFNAACVTAVFLLAGRWASLVPLASLGAVLVVIGVGLIDVGFARRMLRASRGDALVFAFTLVATLLLPLQYAVFVGVFLNLGLYLRTVGRLHISRIVRPAAGQFAERPLSAGDRGDAGQVVLLQLEGDLFFAVADELRDRLAAVASAGARVVVLRLKRVHSVDGTVLHALDQFAAAMHDRGAHVLLCGVRPELVRPIRGSGLIDRIGERNVFPAGDRAYSSVERALTRASELAGHSIDASGLDLDDQDLLMYEI